MSRRDHTPSRLRRAFHIVTLAVFAGQALATSVLADPFDDQTSYWLRKGVADLEPSESISMKDGFKLALIGKRVSSPCIVVKTDEDNLAKALVTWGFRKTKDGRVPVVLIERYTTYRGDRENLTTATGRDVMLFPGLGFNFDIGQVVPAGLGEDILCVEDGTLKPAQESKLYGLNGPAAPEPEAEGKYPDPKSHSGVLPTDFAGKWDVNIDGRWMGRWELDVEDRGIYGKFISEDTKSVYELGGKISAVPHNAKIEIELAAAAQAVDAYLWTSDKSTMAGTVIMVDRKVGFFAVRVKE
jgi:hypothetical protein